MRRNFLYFLLTILLTKAVGQTPNYSVDLPAVDSLIQFNYKTIGQAPQGLNSFFYFLPIDSCISSIKSKTADASFFKTRSSTGEKLKVNLELIKDNDSMDSIRLEIGCHGIPIGGSINHVSPVQNEQWLTSTIFFKSNSASFDFFLKQKSKLDSFSGRPYLKTDAKEIEYTYSFDSNIEGVRKQLIHFTYEIGQRKIRTSYRLIFTNNKCNCN